MIIRAINKYIFKPINQRLIEYYQRKLPIDSKTIVFETEGDYCDNGRVLFEYMIKHGFNKDYHIVWFVHNPKEYPSYENVEFVSRFSRKINRYSSRIIATAKCFLFTHPGWLKQRREGQVVVNLTHSTMQLKAGAPSLLTGTLYDYILCASEEAKKIKKKTYLAAEKQCVIMGAPRNDLLLNGCDLTSLIPGYRGERIFLSMSTFKQSTGNWSDSDSYDIYSMNVVRTEEELLKLNDTLERLGIILLVKIHHLQSTKYIKMCKLSNIIYLTDDDLKNAGIQLYELLGKADGLFTDYSSVFYDYLLLDRPIGFYIGDMQEYSRGFCVDNVYDAMPGEKIKTFDELLDFYYQFDKGVDSYKEVRKGLADKVHFYKDNHSERLAEWIKHEIME